MLRMIKGSINWLPGQDTVGLKPDIVEVDLDALVLQWLKAARTKASLSITDANLEKFITSHSPEKFIKESYLS